MKNRPKLLIPAVLTAALVIFAVVYLWPFVFRHHYEEEDRPVYYGPLRYYWGCYGSIPEPPINDLTTSADLIFTGTVLTGGREILKVEPSTETVRDESFADYRIFHKTVFTVKVNEVWFGECREKIIKVYLPGVIQNNVSRPSRGDRIVFFVSLSEDPLHGEHYAVEDETGLFVLNPPDNSIFALDDYPGFSEFDGYSPEAFRETAALYWKED